MVNGGLILAATNPRCRHPRRRVTQYSVKLKTWNGGDYWIPAFAGMTALLLCLGAFLTEATLVLRGKNAVAPRLQSDDIADLKFAVPRRIDLDHGLAAGRR